MIRFECEFDSLILATKVKLRVYLPNKLSTLTEVKDYKAHYTYKPFKTLFLLHGAWDNAEQWVENTNIVWQAQEKNIALVLPSMGNNFYSNTACGDRYHDFFVDEMMNFARALFPLSEKREDNFICGVSMGGYGALQMCFKHPAIFSKCAYMSGGVDVAYAVRFTRILGINAEGVLGIPWKELSGSKYDLKTMATAAGGRYHELPDILCIDSKRDYFYGANQDFNKFMTEQGIRFEYREYEGEHDWAFWSRHTEEIIDWLTP